MPDEQSTKLFQPPNLLKAKIGGDFAGLDMAAIKRAETAMENLKSEFSDWIANDIAHLCEAHAAYAAARDAASADELFRASHDLKGQATTFEYPLVARIAASLCKLIDEIASLEAIPPALVDAHVDAIRAIHRDKIKNISNLTALKLVEELEMRTFQTLELPSHKD